MRVETIGAATLYSGCGVFNPHVAALAKADKVCERVCFLGAGEKPKRSDVVNRNGRAYVSSALLTASTVPRHSRRSSRRPALAAIGGRSADPVRRITPRLLFSLVRRVAPLRTEAPARLRYVLPRKPRLQLEALPAPVTVVRLALNEIEGARPFRRERIRRTQALAVLVPDHAGAAHFARCHVPPAAALEATEARLGGPVWLYLEGAAADFACLDYLHAKSIAQAQRQSDLFIKPADAAA